MSLDQDIKKEGYLEVVYGPRWKYTTVVRNFVQEFLSVAISGKKRADKIALAAAELVENSVKYSNKDGTKIILHTEKVENNRLILVVENYASREQINKLEEYFMDIKNGDPLSIYLSKMQQAVVRKDDKSQIGLARIQYESEADLKLTTKDDKVIVTATFKLDGGNENG